MPLSNMSTVCNPICLRTCVHGYCSEPDICTCDSGYQIQSDKYVCEPICNQKCDTVTAFCTKPNTCQCFEGYEKLNSTTCVPKCEKPCQNGICTAPDTCTCYGGYSIDPDNIFTCKPICYDCENGICTSPGICTCNKGYSLSNENNCKPVCNEPCQMGTCIAPNTCMCHNGYGFLINSTNKCEPICEKGCINGYCTQPNVCKCHEGFQVTDDESSLHVCIPHCKFPCEPNGKCTAPNVCTCHEGYSHKDNKTIYFNNELVCQPICEKKCIHGLCIAPNKCSCYKGYGKLNIAEPNVCSPICEPSCWSHSKCTAPSVCTCDEDYVLVKKEENSLTCEPNCQPPCPPNSICSSPGLCTCEENYLPYTYNGSMNCEPICTFDCLNGKCSSPDTCTCDSGYINNEYGSCVAYCSFGCAYGNCTDPEICTCDEGYISTNNNQTCEPYCANGCNNGECVAPDDCQCNTGFVKNGNDTDSICVNACKDACNHKGVCLDDQGNCDCLFGWKGIACEVATYCVVFVSKKLQIYETLTIFEEDENELIFFNKTNPKCQQCLNEIYNETICYELPYNFYGEQNYSTMCLVDAMLLIYKSNSIDFNDSGMRQQKENYFETYLSPFLGTYKIQRRRINYRINNYPTYRVQEKCCKGFKQVSNFCLPDCFPQCENGSCVAPNVCECSQGYAITTEDKHICKPICSNGCSIGKCVQPEVCVCPEHYFLDSDGYHCIPTCFYKCNPNNSYCSGPNTCSCDIGFKKSNESDICEPICERECINSKCVEPEHCHCNDNYEPDVDDVYKCIPKCEQKCIFGKCTAPNVCTCNEGYEAINETHCKPICTKPCIMGICIAPDICICHEGYRLIEENDTTNNISVSNNKSNTTCVPICSEDCTNGKCVLPDVCICDKGYNKIWIRLKLNISNNYPCDLNGNCNTTDQYNDTNEQGKYVCQPFCDINCEHGSCKAPNVCACDEGYEINQDGKCVNAICNSSCINGNCTEPNVCTCFEGYYQQNETICEPICNDTCINGTCTEPNVCTCFEEYFKQNETICEPICNSSCLNGTCVAPNTCQCNEGYFELKNDNISVCTSRCSRNCSGHGTCLDERNSSCICYLGWTGSDCNESNLCVYETTLDSSFPSSVTVMNETNSTLTKSYDKAPLCYQCSDSLDNATLCFIVQSNESLTIPTVGCFLSTELPCYRRSHNNALKNTISKTILLVVVTIIIVLIAAITGYFIVRKHRKKATISTKNDRNNRLSSYSNTLIEEDYLIEQ
ncbi:hypothetical protein M0802_012521 [Mischocyttarus mexicanus]|nr:hypothetical protein M0802_012521 [Mischocyttarus mexicanus]